MILIKKCRNCGKNIITYNDNTGRDKLILSLYEKQKSICKCKK